MIPIAVRGGDDIAVFNVFPSQIISGTGSGTRIGNHCGTTKLHFKTDNRQPLDTIVIHSSLPFSPIGATLVSPIHRCPYGTLMRFMALLYMMSSAPRFVRPRVLQAHLKASSSS